MSLLDSALWKRIVQIIQVELRPFSRNDFAPTFKLDGKEFSISPGTFRNKISDLLKAGKIEVLYYSPQAFYTITVQEHAISMTGTPIGVIDSNPRFHHRRRYRYLSNDPVYRVIQNIPLGRRSLHDIHLRFVVNGIWSILSSKYKPNPENNGIPLPPECWEIMGLDIKVTVQPTDTISVVIGCSFCPVAVDIHGVVRLSEALAIVRERLCQLVVAYTSQIS